MELVKKQKINMKTIHKKNKQNLIFTAANKPVNYITRPLQGRNAL